MENKKLKILMVAAEAAPFARVGGLSDVVGSLPLALAKLNCDVRVIIPLYGAIDRKKFKLQLIAENISVPSAGKIKKVNVWQTKFPRSRVISYFIESDYFKRKEIYKLEGNNAEPFLFFSAAVLRVLPIIKFQPDIIHCHDFHTALVTDMLKTTKDPLYQAVKTVYTIHNLNYQGASGLEILSTGNLGKNSLASLSRDAQDGDVNFMVQGILNADLVNTVSKTYAKEIATTDYGANLEKVTKLRKIYGILNGLDTELFNPATDRLIAKKYSAESLPNKIINKLALQKQLGFDKNERMPLVGMVTRLTWQKGID
ncbi:MAG: glycogen/starch synthase, partial [Candidatus Falkowbacteria bacterium]|nr:glycogen/starch synthase [Candidatus Falkowbacteria bacterium]